jgi:hypothetical protein
MKGQTFIIDMKEGARGFFASNSLSHDEETEAQAFMTALTGRSRRVARALCIAIKMHRAYDIGRIKSVHLCCGAT